MRALLVLLLACAPALAAPPETELQRGLDALAKRWHVIAYRLCGNVAAHHSTERLPALLCQARAALGLRWPSAAVFLARAALREDGDRVEALLLLGDALRADGRCAETRPVYLDVLLAQEGHRGAVAGLQACSADYRVRREPQEPPPLPPLPPPQASPFGFARRVP